MMLHRPPPSRSPAPVRLYLALLLPMPALAARESPDITPRDRMVSNIGLFRNWVALSPLSSLSRPENSCDLEVLLRL